MNNNVEKKSNDRPEVSDIIDFARSKGLKRNSFTGRVENADGSPYEDLHHNSDAVELRERYNYVAKDLVKLVFGSDRIPEYNPLKEWLHACPQGDGEVDKLLKAIKLKNECPEKNELLIKWLLQIVAVIQDDAVPRLVLVLIGKSYIGKTEVFRRLLPSEVKTYNTESGLTRENDTEILLSAHLLVNVDELSGILSKPEEVERFRYLASADSFTIRRSYGTFHQRLKRRAVLGGTSNKRDIILDYDATNTRIIPLEIESIDHEKFNAVDKNKLFGELRTMYSGPEHLALSASELKFLGELSEEHTAMDLEKELILRYTEPSDEFISASEIYERLSSYTGLQLSQRKIMVALEQLDIKRDKMMIRGSVLKGYSASLNLPSQSEESEDQQRRA